MNRRIAVAVAFAVLLVASAYAQTTDFFELVKTGTPQSVQDAIIKGANVKASDIGGMTPLINAAAYNKNPEVITILLKAGADIEARDLRPGIGGTALIWAAYANENSEVIATLLKAGANIKSRTGDDRTALIWAAENNPNPEVIMVLLNAGADAKAKDKAGMTAFDYARYTLKGIDALKQLEKTSK